MTTHLRLGLSGAPLTLLGSLLLAAATVGTWLAWLSWNTGYQTDPQTGAVSGPYAVWQVAGCVLTLAVVAAAGGWWLSPWLVAPVMAVAFTVPWAVQAASTDGSGLWAVGATLVLIGTAAGGGVVSLGTHLLHRRLTGS
ncbi:hypothetical protein [Micromonospora avicenniae]|uniref:Uncharacterized protein n=1 Tax=Micromonospora avicenniae TaxID=1198245 RepID=A0A1N6ZD98_9ACTN|nr:hypothetical protein [Micromonospora avicenniae]SIR24741.1 hypothetical protein SAMN05444858_107285 [Micromonospora avicenniae]